MANCVVRNHTGNGIEFNPTGSSRLALSDTLAADNGGFSFGDNYSLNNFGSGNGFPNTFPKN